MPHTRRPWLELAALAAALTALRVAWIVCVPDADMDAYGHFGAARRLCNDPWNLSIHWVWLPLYHFVLAAIACTKCPFMVARTLSACFVAVLPLVVYRYDGRGTKARQSTAYLAALACALAAIPNLMGVSAQQESLFSLCILGAAWAIDARQFWSSGILLAAGCLIRYEAWGAVGLVIAQTLLLRLARLSRRGPQWLKSLEPFGVSVVLPPVIAIAGWIVVHRVVEGRWLGFLTELYRFTHNQRAVLSHGPLMDALWFPILVPLLTFGPMVVFAPFGLKRAFQRGWIIPSGIYLFLIFSYAGQGILGGQRYYGSLAPFICIMMAHSIEQLLRPAWLRKDAQRALIATVVLTTSVNCVLLIRSVNARYESLVSAEARMNASF